MNTHTQAYTATGEKISQISTQAPTFTVSWHPKKHLLAYACDDKVQIYMYHINMVTIGTKVSEVEKYTKFVTPSGDTVMWGIW